MTSGTIIIEQIDRQYAKIRNGGGNKVFNFLKANARHFLTMSDGPLQNAHALTHDRLDKFEVFARSNGFEVVRRWGRG